MKPAEIETQLLIEADGVDKEHSRRNEIDKLQVAHFLEEAQLFAREVGGTAIAANACAGRMDAPCFIRLIGARQVINPREHIQPDKVAFFNINPLLFFCFNREVIRPWFGTQPHILKRRERAEKIVQRQGKIHAAKKIILLQGFSSFDLSFYARGRKTDIVGVIIFLESRESRVLQMAYRY